MAPQHSWNRGARFGKAGNGSSAEKKYVLVYGVSRNSYIGKTHLEISRLSNQSLAVLKIRWRWKKCLFGSARK